MDTYTLKLTRDQVAVIGAALNEMPHRVSRSVIDSIDAQIARAETAKTDVPASK